MRYITACLLGVGVACALLWVLTPLAVRMGLVARPGHRKLHQGNVSLVGGMAMFAAFTLCVLTLDISLPSFGSFLAAAALLVGVGFVGDLWGLAMHIRFATQITAALIMTLSGSVIVENLGAITGIGDVTLGELTIPFTVFATVGVINTINMSDGIDGLAGGLSFIAFMLLSCIAAASGRIADASVLILLTSIVGALLIFNLQFPWRPRALAFMGDSGSTFLGFALAWFAISLSQGEERAMTPVTALWILALPLIDTVSILIRRVLSGRSPFTGDRDHLHHVLLHAGCSVNTTNIILWSVMLMLGAAGIFAFYRNISELALFYGFLGLAFSYLWLVLRIHRNANEANNIIQIGELRSKD